MCITETPYNLNVTVSHVNEVDISRRKPLLILLATASRATSCV